MDLNDETAVRKAAAELEWKPIIYYCGHCEDVIWSATPGQFAQCKCGNSYVDQTRHYCRVGGNALPVEPILEEREEKDMVTFKKFQKKMEKAHSKLPKPPYHHHFSISLTGDLEVREETVLCPEEALRLGRWLVDFYSECDEE